MTIISRSAQQFAKFAICFFGLKISAVETGEAELARKKRKPDPSKIMLEEYFSSEHEDFVGLLKEFQSDKYLASFVMRWIADKREWTRQQVIEYVAGDLNLPGHEVVFKRLYKYHLAMNDHDILGAFMVALDRMVRRARVTSRRYNWQTRDSWTTESFRAKPNKSVKDVYGRTRTHTHRGKDYTYPLPDIRNERDNVLFSHRTRNYLRRSVWRYFRHLSYRDPHAYVSAMGKALVRYKDEHLETGEAIIDNWSLMHACYFHHDAIDFSPTHTNVVEGRSLNELSARPYQPAAWQTDEAAGILVEILLEASSTLVRIWALELFKQYHSKSIGKIAIETLIRMMSSPDPNVQQFAAELFEEHPKLPTLTVAEWLSLLETSDPSLLSKLCQVMRKHVAEQRLNNEQLIQLACAQQDPVSTMGFDLIKARHASQPLNATELGRLSQCQCTTQANRIAIWSLNQISASDYDSDHVIDFFDALLRPTREAAMSWLAQEDSPGFNDAKLWAQLMESPFDDIRIELIELLEQRTCRQQNPKYNESVTPVWVSVIHGIHRGGRTKPKAIRQIGRKIRQQTDEADNLLPVLAVAFRSIRAPEMRSALTTVVQLANESPQMKAKVASHFPELEFVESGVV